MGWLPLTFGFPAILFGLLALPVIWWLLRLTPPRPQQEVFPPLRILARVLRKEETPNQSPWWLTLLRLLMAALVVLALAIYRFAALKRPGLVTGLFVAGYALSRITVEFFREPDPQLGYLFGGWLTMGMLLSLPMLAAGLWAIFRARPASA